MSEIIIHDQPYICTMQRQKRKTLQIQLPAPDTLHIKAPDQLPIAEITAFVLKKSDWIHLKNRALKDAKKAVAAPALESGSKLPFKGNTLILEVTKSFCKPKITLREDKLCVNLYLPNAQDLPGFIKRWYIRRAAEHLTERTAFWSEKIGVKIQRISIKEQKTRWGSCSSLGNLNYNWRIILAPEKTIDYLVVHEVSHRVHLNHAKPFWQLVALHCPDFKEHRLWLKQHGHQMQNFL